MLCCDERIDGISNPAFVFYFGDGRLRDGIEWAPLVGGEEFAEFGCRGALGFCRSVFWVTGIVAEEKFDFIGDAVFVGVFFGDGGEAFGDGFGFAEGAQGFAEWIVREIVEEFGIFIRAREMAGGAAIKVFAEEGAEVALECGFVCGRGVERYGRQTKTQDCEYPTHGAFISENIDSCPRRSLN